MTQPTLGGRRGLISPHTTLERLLQCAVNSLATGKRAAHCYSAHVPGQGYVNKGDHEHTRADYLAQLARSAQSEVDNFRFSPGYAEPGYKDPARGIVFANWNVFPRGFDRILEYAGFAVEWSDEWIECSGCYKAVRTSPDSHSWSPSYSWIGDCEILCAECIADDPAQEITNV